MWSISTWFDAVKNRVEREILGEIDATLISMAHSGDNQRVRYLIVAARRESRFSMSSQLKSPFPGMDPFLEVNPLWQEFHGWFIRELARLNSRQARDVGCQIAVERNVYRREPSGEMVLIGEPGALVGPDLSVAGWDHSAFEGNAVATAELKAIHRVQLDPDQMEIYKQDYLVVRELGSFTRILAVVELLSFANKLGSYLPRYREKRMRMLGSLAHFMEIDFLRAGDNRSRQMFPELTPSPYFIIVARKTDQGREEAGYPIHLQDRLPIVGLPLGPGRPDLPLDLAAAFESAFDLCTQTARIDYRNEAVPEPPLTVEDAMWVKGMFAANTHV